MRATSRPQCESSKNPADILGDEERVARPRSRRCLIRSTILEWETTENDIRHDGRRIHGLVATLLDKEMRPGLARTPEPAVWRDALAHRRQYSPGPATSWRRFAPGSC